MARVKRIAILGSTGSIGCNTLEVVAQFPERFQVVALAAGQNVELLLEQAKHFKPSLISCQNPLLAEQIRHRLPKGIELLSGKQGVREVATCAEADLVVSAISGAIGLQPTYWAICAGKDVALANKESLVCAGELIMREVMARNTLLLPVDSEHSAIFQALQGHRREDVARLILTASGGPFRDWPLERLKEVTVEQALKHPNWQMGKKITIDSATLMNKGLEVIEAFYLFQVPLDHIQVVVHPQSIIHSLVEYCDGSLLAQLGPPDMRLPIAYALAYPERLPLKVKKLDLLEVARLTFEPPDEDKFPCLRLAYEAARMGGTAPAILNAANEEAVEAFLTGRLRFDLIPRVVEAVLEMTPASPINSLGDVFDADILARLRAQHVIQDFLEKSP